jgi:hypothetical protein
MSDARAQFERMAAELSPLCEHISVRTDEAGPFIFAIGLKGTHTLEMRRSRDMFVVEEWHGSTAEEEVVVSTPEFANDAAALAEARSWLSRDVV